MGRPEIETLLKDITRNSPLALYYQVKQRILEAIDRGKLKPGDRLPAEREAAESSGLSRMTVRQAYTELMAEGVLVRRPGRGTFVAGRKAHYGIAMPGGFTEETQRRGLEPETRVVGVDEVRAPREAAEALELEPGEVVYRIRRRHSVNRRPVDYAVCYVSRRLFPGLEKHDLSSLYRTFSDRYDTQVVRAEESIEPRRATKEAAGALDVPRGTLVLFMRRTSYSELNLPVEYVELFLNSQQYRFVMEVRRDTRTGVETMTPVEVG